MTNQPTIKCSINTSIVNKPVPWAWAEVNNHWQPYEGTAEALLNEVIFKGHALNQSLFPEDQGHKGHLASGGNLIVFDLDDGITYDKILASPTYQMYGSFIYPSASCGVVADKDGVDGRERWRVGFILGREVHTDIWTQDEGQLRLGKKRQHLERIACTVFLTDNFCADVGIPKLKDNCHKTVGQPFFGNDGSTVIPLSTDNQKQVVHTTYPCSTETRSHINGRFLPVEDMERVIDAYRLSHPEIFEERELPSADELNVAAEKARWIFDHDLLSEKQLTDRDISIKEVVACARGLGDDTLLESFLGTMERVMDGHPWRTAYELERAWWSYSEVSSYTIGTLIHHADEASPGWRDECPLMGAGSRKVAAIPLSECFILLKSTNPINIII